MQSPSDLLKSAWSLYSNNLKLLFSIFIAPALFIIALSLYLGIDGDQVRFDELRERFSLLEIASITICLAIANMLMGLALIRAIANPIGTGVTQAYTFAINKLIPYLVLSIVTGIIIGIGFILLVVPGVIFIVWFMFAQLILLLENRGPIDALKRSREYVRGKWFKVAGRLGFLILVTVVISIAVSIVASIVGEVTVKEAGLIVTQVGNFLLVPLSMSYMYLFYLDVRAAYESTTAPIPDIPQNQQSAESDDNQHTV